MEMQTTEQLQTALRIFTYGTLMSGLRNQWCMLRNRPVIMAEGQIMGEAVQLRRTPLSRR